jgi:hypothetical protein
LRVFAAARYAKGTLPEDHPLRAETEALVDDIRQALSLLRRHL